MAPLLHITKVAVGCAEIDALRDRMAARAEGGETWLVTRFRPKRDGELIGGSVYWIIKHRLVARQQIIGFVEDETDGAGGIKRCRIVLSAEVRPVRPHPKRAHQGWRYLAGADVPQDLGGDEVEGMAGLPGYMATELAALALI